MNWKKTVKRKLRQPFETFGFTLLLLSIPLFPRWLIRLHAQCLARITIHFFPSHRKTAHHNLDAVYKESRTPKEKKAILTQSTASFILTFLDLIWFAFRTPQRIKKYIDTSALDAELESSLPSTIFITAHLGNWELLGQLGSSYPFSLTSVAAPIKNQAINRLLNQRREKNGQQIISTHGAIKKMLSALHKGANIGLLIDQPISPKKGGIPIHFIHSTTYIAPTAALLAYRTQSPLRFIYCLPQKKGHYQISLSDPLLPPPHQSNSQNHIIHTLAQTIADQLSKTILKYPHTWIWSYPYWKKYTP
jgi:KDO2-lipid IV(A) lauroyltransferase